MSRLLVIIPLLLLAACSNDPQVTALLDRADSLTTADPDSALRLLTCPSSREEGCLQGGVAAKASRSQRMRHALLTARAQNKAFVDFTTDSMLLEVTDYYDRHGTPNEQMEAHYLLGCAYRDMGEAPHAVDCYLDAIAKADTTAKDCDFYTISCIYSQMAYIYHNQLLLSYEIEAHRKASYYSYLSKDTLYAIYEQKMIACAYILQNKKDSAAIIVDKAMHSYHEHGYLQEELQASLLLMHLYVDTPEKLGEVKQLMERYEALSEAFSEKGSSQEWRDTGIV